MIIKRAFFNDTFHPEIELTPKELYEAYVEQEHIYDVSNTKNYLGDAYTDEEIDAIAYDARRQADKYDLEWYDAVEEALNTLQMHKDDEEDDEEDDCDD